MSSDRIKRMQIAAEEYRILAGELQEILLKAEGEINDGEGARDRSRMNILEEMESEINELNRLSDDLQEMAVNYLNAGAAGGQIVFREDGRIGPEFGESVFYDLERHERLIRIHHEG